MATTTVECPFCHTSSDPAATSGYCESCGRRLPVSSAYTTSKRGRRLRGELSSAEPEALQPKQRTAGALVTATILRLVLGGGFLVLGPVFLGRTLLPEWFLPGLLGFTVAGTALYGLLAWWATTSPVPAAYTALGAFLAIWAGVLIAFPVAWPLALVDLILLGCLVYTVMICGQDRL